MVNGTLSGPTTDNEKGTNQVFEKWLDFGLNVLSLAALVLIVWRIYR